MPPDYLPNSELHENSFILAFGRMVISWNISENRMKSLLAFLCGWSGGWDLMKNSILTAELANVGLCNALNAFSKNLFSGEVSESLNYAVTYFERLRIYRNYYVHGLTEVVKGGETGPIGIIKTHSAKGRLIQTRDFISVTDIKNLDARAGELLTFIDGVINHLAWDRRDPSDPRSERPPLPRKPPLPDKLEKTAMHYPEPTQQPGPFPV